MITKSAEIYTHTLGMNALENIINSGGNIKSVRHIAKEDPDKELYVETTFTPAREVMRAEDAYNKMLESKDPDKIFFMKDKYIPGYGDCTIVANNRKAVIPYESKLFNTLDNEFTTGRKVSLHNRNVEVYVPDDSVDSMKKLDNRIKFIGKSKLAVPQYTLADRIIAVPKKLFRRAGNIVGFEKTYSYADSHYKKLFGSPAQLVGSEALGINLPESSDTDVLLVYKRKNNFEKAIDRISKKYPDLKMTQYSINRPDKKILSGFVNGTDMDVAIAYGDNALRFRDTFNAAKHNLTDKKRKEIVDKKRALKNAWFFPEYRYKKYKKDVVKDLGIAEWHS